MLLMCKKWLSLVLILVLTLGMIPTAYARDPQTITPIPY